MRKALVLAPFAADALQALSDLVSVTYESWIETGRLYDPEELAQRLQQENFSILIIEADFAFEELFAGAPSLKFLGVCRNSLDHVDMEAATRHGVCVVNTPGRNARAVAEMTIGLALALARHLPQAHKLVKELRWENPTQAYVSLRGIELQGKMMGILGLGSIGRQVAKLARALGMRVVAFDPYVEPTLARRVGADLASLDEVLQISDFLTLHLPTTSTTEGLLSQPRLALMKPGAYLINTSGPALVDQQALVTMLQSGRLGGAALDVHESHPIAPNNPFLGLENVILTPHIGGATHETVYRHSWMMFRAIESYLVGRRPRNLANPQVWRRRG